jgi:tetratricopeptide (TPR) repeat protein
VAKKNQKTELIDLICAAENNPGDIDARLAVAHEYERRREKEKALEELKEIARAFPANPAAFLELGNFFLRNSWPLEAAASYFHAIKLDPNSHEARHNLGLAYIMSRDFEKATAQLEAAVSLKPEHLESHLVLASAQMETGKPRQAAMRLESLWKINRANPRLLYLLAAANLKIGEHLKAMLFINEGLKAAPGDRAMRLLKAEILIAQSQYAPGIKEYDALLAEKPDNAFVLGNRGLARQMTGDADGAMQDFDRALELEPDNPVALVNRGLLLALRGMLRRAFKDLAAALKFTPNDPRLLHNLAVVCLKLGEHDQAVAYLRAAAKLDHEPSAQLLKRLAET